MSKKVKTKAADPIPTNPLTAPESLPDERSIKDKVKDRVNVILSDAEESVIVDAATNAAAELVERHSAENLKNLGEKVDKFFDNVITPNAPRLLRPLLRMIPIAGLINSQIGKLVELIVEWLRDFSTASEENDA